MDTVSLRPVLALLFASTAWGLLWYPLRWLDGAGIDGLWSILVLNLAALLVGAFVIPARYRDVRDNLGLLLLLSLVGGWCNLGFILAIIDGEVMRVMLLFYLAPLWATIFARLILGESITARSALVVAVALSGAVIMLWAPGLGWPYPQGESDWLAISAGMAFALTNVLMRKGRHLGVGARTAATWWGGLWIAALWLYVLGHPLPTASGSAWSVALLVGGIGLVLMTAAVVYGVSHMPVRRSAVLMLFELVVASISAALLTDEQMLPREWLGGALIVAAAFWSARSPGEPNPS